MQALNRTMLGESYKLVFRAKSTIPFTIPAIKIHLPSDPYYDFNINPIQLKPVVSTDWATYTIYFRANNMTIFTSHNSQTLGVPKRTMPNARLTFYLGGALPEGADFNIDSVSIKSVDLLDSDVGNLIFTEQPVNVGKKKWGESELKEQGDFWYDNNEQTVKFFSSTNPADYYNHKIECALRWKNGALIYINAQHDIVIQDLDIRYAGAHGIKSDGSFNITIQRCDLSFIGGSEQVRKDGSSVRYGNGIEFWNSNKDTDVRYCRLDQIYDAALTTQGDEVVNYKHNQHFYYNIITNSEYSFEFWNRPSGSSSQNITFQNNTCAFAGKGWGHDQRLDSKGIRDPSGYHVVFYENTATTNDIFIRNNIFYEAEKSALLVVGAFRDLLNVVLDNNVYFQSSGKPIDFNNVEYGTGEVEFKRYQNNSQKDTLSVFKNPLLKDPTNGNFDLDTGSPCIGKGEYVSYLPQRDFNGAPVLANSVDIGALVNPPVNGVCGSSDGLTYTIAPSSNLCSSGTASTVTGTGPWTWECQGVSGGTTATCHANIQTYAITSIVTGGNGIVSCTTPVNHGATSTCTITPASGFQIATFTDNGADMKAYVTGNSYSITNVSAAHAITATFFTTADMARIVGGLGYPSLLAACNAAINGTTIMTLDAELTENLIINKQLNLICGYNTMYSSRTGDTELKGVLTIGAGGRFYFKVHQVLRR